jgi:hypothetical protein
MALIELGIIQSSLSMGMNYKNPQPDKFIKIEISLIGGFEYSFVSDIIIESLRLPVFQLTQLGTEIASLIDFNETDENIQKNYIQELSIFLKTKNLNLIL